MDIIVSGSGEGSIQSAVSIESGDVSFGGGTNLNEFTRNEELAIRLDSHRQDGVPDISDQRIGHPIRGLGHHGSRRNQRK